MTHRLQGSFLMVLFASLIAVPKSGFVLGGIPINSLYIVIAVSLPFLLLSYFTQKDQLHRYSPANIYIVLLLPFFAVFLLVTLSNGIDNPAVYVGYVVALIVSPLYFFILFQTIGSDQVARSLPFVKLCIRFAGGYGLALFFYHLVSGSYFEIPGITTTFGATKTLDQRMNDRGQLFKLTSTYNNGNIYAVCALMLLPLYRVLEKNKLWFFVVLASIVLTLSRLAWALLLLYFVFEYFLFSGRLALRKLLAMFFLGASVIPLILFLLHVMERDVSFLFDPNLGGRASYLQTFFDASFISGTSLYWSYEIPYVSIAEFVGFVGIPLFLLYFIAIPLRVKSFFDDSSPIVRAATMGCLIYFFATLIDGALILVPVFSIFSFLVMLSLSGIGNGYFARGRNDQGWCGHLSQ